MDNDAPEVQARWRRRVPYLYAALFALVFWTFLPAIDNDFIGYDDPAYVTENYVVQRGLTWENVRWAVTATEVYNWHPLTWLSHMLDVQLFGLNPSGHHLTSIVLHGVNALLVFALLHLMTGARGRSWMVAALFALHPLRAESVVWVSERKDVLAAFFWLLTTLAYVRAIRLPKNDATIPDRFPLLRSPWYWVMVTCFALGLMCKAMLVTLPFTLLLLDVWPLKRFNRDVVMARILEKIPLFALTLAISLVTFIVQKNAGSVNENLAPALRWGNVIVSYARYLGKIFWPTDLTFFYPMPTHWSFGIVLGAALLLATVTVLAFLSRRKQPAFGIGWLWYLGTLVPVIGIVAVGQQAMADRYTYIPTLGILFAVVWGIHTAVTRYGPLLPLVNTITFVTLGILMMLSRQQTRFWKNTETLCRQAICVTKDNHLAHDLLGVALNAQGKSEAALFEHRESLRIKPTAVPQNNAGVALQKLGRYEAAVTQHQLAIQLKSDYPEAFYNLGAALERLNRIDEAMTNYLHAIALRPNYADAHYNLGTVHLKFGQWEDARREFEQALALTAPSPDTFNNLGVALLNLGRYDQAIERFKAAIQLRPEDPRFYFNAGAGFHNLGNVAAATQYYQEALRLKPDYAEARANLELLRAPAPAR